ncbi:sulfurtransferase complex subunit TusB [Shewanella intestini]|uniref:Sulfurtransferase complex subunit TusB n=1 Tax=Shewanella intestini TaxID=2017544 RepID=A0ABS5HZD3_9GAMM|nr:MULTISPECIES: sulfurtransferase complex subunit TusB [Shewanella]MBR9727149.1 sulfurtransferase complex subunit TusB [Shewanella intestini]MRG35951.1 sulfurtransferase complex subunit TusB [Shewanella sp. XMDDZSB0408]
MNLHHIQTSAYTDNALSLCLRYYGVDDAILLAGDAINCLLDVNWQTQLQGKTLYLLESDMLSRGLKTKLENSLNSSHITVIDYAGFVSLSLQFSKVITW